MKRSSDPIDAFPLTERQQDVIFGCLKYCRALAQDSHKDDDLAQEITQAMRLFAERN